MNTSTSPRHDHPAEWPAAVLFDLDGTLVDTERLWLDAVRAQLEHIDGPVSPARVAEFEGLSTVDAARALIAIAELPAHETAVATELEDRTMAAFAGRRTLPAREPSPRRRPR